jgi:hypothetical protein
MGNDAFPAGSSRKSTESGAGIIVLGFIGELFVLVTTKLFIT